MQGKKKLEVTVSEKDFMTHCYDLQLWHLLCYIHFQAYYLFQIQILNLNQPIIYVILLYFKLAPIKVIKLAFFGVLLIVWSSGSSGHEMLDTA